MNSQLLRKIFKITQLPVRAYSVRTKGIKFYGFTYYPRTEDFKDPPCEPSKLFLVKRIKSMRGITPKERVCLELLNIDGFTRDRAHINVVKNIPQVNALLWKVKHLVEIKPITYKGELPKDGDYSGTYLRETGELVITPKIKVTSEQIEVSEKFIKDSKRLSRTYIKEYLKKKWLNGYSGSV